MGTILRATPALLGVLRLLLAAPEPLWGLQLVKDGGFPSGTVYPLLARLEEAGHVTSTWEAENERRGPRRRLYDLTPDGRRWAHGVVARGNSSVAPAAKTVTA